MTGLETRGYHPKPDERGSLARIFVTYYHHKWRLRRPSIDHMCMWGVPCGPTLSMVNPPILRGIKSLLDESDEI